MSYFHSQNELFPLSKWAIPALKMSYSCPQNELFPPSKWAIPSLKMSYSRTQNELFSPSNELFPPSNELFPPSDPDPQPWKKKKQGSKISWHSPFNTSLSRSPLDRIVSHMGSAFNGRPDQDQNLNLEWVSCSVVDPDPLGSETFCSIGSVEVTDSDPDPKQESHLIKNHLKIIKNKQFDNYDIKKNVYLKFSLKSTGLL
jgi:hypothetical protein